MWKEDFSFLLNNKDLCYLDCAATTPVPDEVLEEWLHYQKNICVSIGRGGNKLTAKAESVYNESVEVIKAFFSCGDDYEIIFTKNATEALNLLACVFGNYAKHGEILLMSEYEHNSSFLPWRRAAQNTGAQLVKLPVKFDGTLDYNMICHLPQEQIKIVMLSLTSNVTGYVLNPEEIRRRVGKDTLIFLDISQTAGHAELNLQKLNADAYVFSAHKMYAPKNIGACIIRKDLVTRSEPFILGGGMVYNLLGGNTEWQPGAMKYMAGTFDVSLVYAWAKACQYLKRKGRKQIFAHERKMFTLFGKIFNEYDPIFVLPNGNVSSALYSFGVKNFHVHDLERFFDKRNIILRAGHMCSQNAMAAFKLNGAMRISWGIFTDENDVDRFEDAIKKICAGSPVEVLPMNPKMLAADCVVESSGMACGDEVKLYLSRQAERLFFFFRCNSCKITLKSARYLEKFSGQTEKEIFFLLRQLEQRKDLRQEDSWIETLSLKDFKCFLTPVTLLRKYFQKNSLDRDFTDRDPLSCDACISVRSVSKKTKSHGSRSIKAIIAKVKHAESDEETDLQKVGLCACTDSLNEKAFLKSVTAARLKIIKQLRLAAPFYNKALMLNCALAPEVKELALKQFVNMKLADIEIGHVEEFIRANNLSVNAVKGQKIREYYPQGFIRSHMDYDYLAANYEDAFRFISYLLNERDFKFITDASVPFSFKAVLDENGEELLTGHVHLEKILQDSFQVVVDINLGSFPLGRTAAIYAGSDGKLTAEDLFCITLAHLFKHELAFVKDINDLYFLLDSGKLNEIVLRKRIREFGLCVEYEVLTKFLRENMNCKTNGGMISVPWKRLSFSKWPYSRYSHFKIKFFSLLLSCQRRWGEKRGLLEAERQLTNTGEPVPSVRYSSLCKFLNSRAYLYPVMIFNRYVDISSESLRSAVQVTDGIFIAEDLTVMPVGIFSAYELKENLSDEELNEKAQKILSDLEIDAKFLNFDCLAGARKDLWLY